MTPVSKPELKGLWLSESENVALTFPCLQIIFGYLSCTMQKLRRVTVEERVTEHFDTVACPRLDLVTGIKVWDLFKHLNTNMNISRQSSRCNMVLMLQKGPKSRSNHVSSCWQMCRQASSPLRSQLEAEVAEYMLPQLNQVFVLFFFFTSLLPLISSKPVCSVKAC